MPLIIAGQEAEYKKVNNIGASLNGIICEFGIEFSADPLNITSSDNWDQHGMVSLAPKVINISNDDAIAFIGVFEDVDTGARVPIDNTVQDAGNSMRHPIFPNAEPITSKYTQITESLKIIDDNIKVCANNIKEGSIKNINNKGFVWIADEPVYPIIMPREGYINFSKFDNNKLCIGICDYEHNFQYDGVLVFPYGPTIMTDKGTPVDAYGPYMEDFHHPGHYEYYETPEGTQGVQGAGTRDGDVASPFYIKTGRLMGSMTDCAIGMITSDANADISDVPTFGPVDNNQTFNPTDLDDDDI